MASPAPPPVQLVAHGPLARDALVETLTAVKRGDPLGPVTVAVPSAFTGLAVRRAVVTPERGLCNVRFLTLAGVAELLGAPRLAAEAAGRRPLTDALRTEAVRAAVLGEPGELRPVASHPATVRSLDATFRELRRAPTDVAAALDGLGGRAALVARLFRAARERTHAFYDEEDLLAAAAGAVHGATPGSATASALAELGPVVLFLPSVSSPGSDALTAALGARGGLHAILGLTGDARADAPVRELANRLARVTGAVGPVEHAARDAAPAPPAGTEILDAPDPEEEMRAVRRAVLDRARRGTPLHRMAILFRNAEPYARLAPELLDAAGLAWNGPSPRRLADTVAGRVLMGLVRLVDAELARDTVAAWMASGPVVDPHDGRPVPASRFDSLSREAGVVAGAEQWRERLARHRARLVAEVAEMARDDDTRDSARQRREADVELLDRLAAFVADLAAHARASEDTTWSGMTRWARGLLDRYLGGERRRAQWPGPELDAARRIEGALDGLGALDALGSPADPQAFVVALEAALAAPTQRVGHYGRGVFVGPLRAALGADFDTVFVLGMAEGAFPPRGRDDPLLPDAERHAAGDGLPARATTRDDEELRDYLTALAAAPQRVLTFPRADPRAQRKRLPARLLLATAARLEGAGAVGAEELLRLGSRPWLTVIPSFEGGLARADEAGSCSERDLRALADWRGDGHPTSAHPLVASTPELAAGFALTAARASRRLGPFDGLVGTGPELMPSPPGAVSPTALQEWAECPFRYLLGRVLRVREVARPEETDTISPLERGALIHHVLEEFVRAATPRTSPDQVWSGEERAQLRELAGRVCDEAQTRGVTGRPLLWRLERRRILRELDGFLEIDERFRAQQRVVSRPDELELGFGFDADGGDPPVDVAVRDGRTVHFRGRIDRVDRAPDGSRVVVVDYKTGRVRPDHDHLEEDPVARGHLLQLPVYALAARQRARASRAGAYYLFTTDAPVPWRGYDLTDDREARFTAVVDAITDGIGAGIFPLHPGDPRSDAAGRDTFTNCAYCAYDRLCPAGRDQLWDRKRDDPAAVRFRALAEPETLEPGAAP